MNTLHFVAAATTMMKLSPALVSLASVFKIPLRPHLISPASSLLPKPFPSKTLFSTSSVSLARKDQRNKVDKRISTDGSTLCVLSNTLTLSFQPSSAITLTTRPPLVPYASPACAPSVIGPSTAPPSFTYTPNVASSNWNWNDNTMPCGPHARS